nr:L,D-transpeptidase family protein [Roseovarius nanhaiticus]
MKAFYYGRRTVLLGGLAAILSGCAARSKFRSYNGPLVTRVRLYKGQRLLVLDSGDSALRTYPVGLGFAPEGHKQFEGDGRTPEGSYLIDRRNPQSKFHLSIGISYPNEADMAFAKAQGKSPGGDIFIHGGPRRGIDPTDVRDWTAGCIALTDRQIEDVYAMVQDGTPIDIYA